MNYQGLGLNNQHLANINHFAFIWYIFRISDYVIRKKPANSELNDGNSFGKSNLKSSTKFSIIFSGLPLIIFFFLFHNKNLYYY